LEFAAPSERPEFWAWFASYDWVALCQLFGPMIDLPKGYPFFVRDLRQLAGMYGNPRVPIPPDGQPPRASGREMEQGRAPVAGGASYKTQFPPPGGYARARG
jgi:hypothetical protein